MNDKITPPEGLERALGAALVDAGFSIPSNADTYSEQLLYSAPIQEWLDSQRTTDGSEKGETAAEPRDPIQVVCTVTVPLSSPHAAADALSRVPIDANVTYEPGKGLLAGVLGVGNVIATWTEER